MITVNIIRSGSVIFSFSTFSFSMTFTDDETVSFLLGLKSFSLLKTEMQLNMTQFSSKLLASYEVSAPETFLDACIENSVYCISNQLKFGRVAGPWTKQSVILHIFDSVLFQFLLTHFQHRLRKFEN